MDGLIIYRTREDLPYTDGIFSRAAQLTLVYNMKRTRLTAVSLQVRTGKLANYRQSCVK